MSVFRMEKYYTSEDNEEVQPALKASGAWNSWNKAKFPHKNEI